MKQPREYQRQAIYCLNRQLNQGNNPALVMPAGSGKTYTAVLLIKDRISLGQKLFVLCGTEEIFDQWILECSSLNINFGYINPEGVIGRNKDIYICMWQSLFNILNSLPEKFCKSIKEIIIDECHHSSSPTLEAIFNHFHHCRLIGLTATLYRYDNQNLGKYFNVMFEPITQSEAIANGFLCPPVILIPDEYKEHVLNIKYPESLDINEQRKLIQDKKIIGDMIGTYKNVFNGELCLIPCSGIKHAALVAEMYRQHGWNVEHLHGMLNKFDRKRIIKNARNHKINILTTYSVGSEGLDIPNIMGTIWMRLTGSLTAWIQINTRAARRFKNKKNYILVDLMGNIVLHGSPAIDRKWSLHTDYTPGQDITEAPTMKECPVCGNMNAVENMKCWVCYFDFETGLLDGMPVDKRRRKMPKFIDGKLCWLEGDYDISNDNRFNNRDNNSMSDRISNREGSGGDSVPAIPVTKTQKIEILKRDLIGLKSKSKFREAVKWL